jgi:hypothetical protein
VSSAACGPELARKLGSDLSGPAKDRLLKYPPGGYAINEKPHK